MFVPSLSWQNDTFLYKNGQKGAVFLPEVADGHDLFACVKKRALLCYAAGSLIYLMLRRAFLVEKRTFLSVLIYK